MSYSAGQRSACSNSAINIMERIRLERFSYRFAEQVLNSKLAIKQEVEAILTSDANPIRRTLATDI